MRKYREGKKEYKELCEQKRKEENHRLEKKAAEAKREANVQEIVNREKKRRKEINKEIEEESLKQHLIIMLGGVGYRVVRGVGEVK